MKDKFQVFVYQAVLLQLLSGNYAMVYPKGEIYRYWNREREREMFYLTTHSTHFIYGYMASDIWLRTIMIVRKKTRCRHIGYSYRLTARVLLYASSHRQDNTYHSLCYTSRGALAEREIAQWVHPMKDRYLNKSKTVVKVTGKSTC